MKGYEKMVFVLILFTSVLFVIMLDNAFSGGFKRRSGIDMLSEIAIKSREYKVDLDVPLEKKIFSFDGTLLNGYLYKGNPKTSVTVILIHGYKLSHREMLGFANFYVNSCGFNVLAPDLRGHGESGGDYICFGVKDREDILAWIEYIKQMIGSKTKIVLHGIYMGAATALMTGAYNDENVYGIIADCPYASGKEMVKKKIKSKYKIAVNFLYSVLDKYVKIRCKFSMEDSDVVEYVKHIKCPVLYIHGASDEEITPLNSYRLYENTNSEKELYIVLGAGHAQSVLVETEKYMKKVKNFIDVISSGQTA